MKSMTTEEKSAWTSANQKYIRIEFLDGETPTIDSSSFTMESASIEQTLTDGDELKFGKVSAAVFMAEIKANDISLVGKKIKVISYTGDYEITRGVFVIDSDTRTTDRTKKNIVAYDEIYSKLNSDVAEWFNGLSFPITIRDLRDSLFSYLSIEQVTASLINDDVSLEKNISAETISGLTIIESICEINACFGQMTEDGKFKYVTLEMPEAWDSDNTITTGEYYQNGLTYEDYKTNKITKVILRQSSDEVGGSYGTDGNNYVLEGNVLLYDKTSEELSAIAENIYNKVKDIEYQPFSLNMKYEPWLEVGDLIKVIGVNNEEITSIILNRTIKGISKLTDEIEANGSENYSTVNSSISSQITILNNRYAKLDFTVDSIQTEVGKKTTMEEVNSAISQSADTIMLEVNKKVSEEGLDEKVSSIIVKPETVAFIAENITLSGDHIELDGDTTIGEDFKLTASNIDSTNLVAEKIEVKDSDNNIIFKADSAEQEVTIASYTVSDTKLSATKSEESGVNLTVSSIDLDIDGIGISYDSGQKDVVAGHVQIEGSVKGDGITFNKKINGTMGGTNSTFDSDDITFVKESSGTGGDATSYLTATSLMVNGSTSASSTDAAYIYGGLQVVKNGLVSGANALDVTGDVVIDGNINTAYKFNNNDMPEGAANLSNTTSAHKINFYRNGLSVPYQMDNSNDGGILRCRGTSESSCILELGTWDDSGAGETIQFNYYPTTSQITPTYSVSVPKKSGTIALTSDTVAAANYSNAVAYTGTGTGVLTAHQTSGDFYNGTGWASYIICNHGDGSSYFHQMIRMPFWGVPEYQRMSNGSLSGWQTFITSENISSQSVNYASSAGTLSSSPTITGCLHVRSNVGSWSEGIRIYPYGGWSTIALCGTDAGSSGTSANTWSIHSYNGNFYIARNGSNDSSSALLKCNDNYWTCGSTSISGNVNFEVHNSSTCMTLSARTWAGLYHESYGSIGAGWLIYMNTAGNCVTNNPSDIRYKNDLGLLSEDEALALLKVEPHVYTYKVDSNETVYQGFIAQDIVKALKDNNIGYRPLLIVSDHESPDQTYEDLEHAEEDVRYGLDYSKLVPVLFKGWQMHEKKIVELEARIAELEKNMTKTM